MKFRLTNTLILASLLTAAASALSAAENLPESPASEPLWYQQSRVALDQFIQQLKDQARTRHQEVKVRIGEIDQRLNFATCSETPEISSRTPASSGRLTVRLRCPGPTVWQLHVTLDVDRFAEVAVLKRAIARGQEVTQQHIKLQRLNTSELRQGFFQDPGVAVGQLARRTLSPGTVLHPGHLDPPKLVKRGDRVIIAARNPVILVRMSGTALSDGRLGQQIPVENQHSGRKILATVVGEARVEVPL